MRFWVALVLVGTCLGVAGQTPVLRRQFTRTPAVAVSMDNYDRVIAADAQGNITAYDTSGNAVVVYSPKTVADVTSLEAWRSMQILVFYRDLQQYTLLDRFLTPLSGYPYPARLPAGQIGFARLMARAYDDQYWIFDDTDFSLKKYDAVAKSLTLHVPLSLVLDGRYYQISQMREYQNQLFLTDAAGVLVFDNLGNYRRKLPLPNAEGLHFAGNELYFLKGKSLVFFDVYTQAQRQMALPQAAQFAVVAGLRLFLFTNRGGFLYDLP